MNPSINRINRVFHKHATLGVIPIVAPKALLSKTKNSNDKILPPVRIFLFLLSKAFDANIGIIANFV